MNENIDLTKILKCCPEGTKFWSMVAGEVEFVEMGQDYPNVLYFNTHNSIFSCFENGKLYHDVGECILFPSKEQRDWSKFVPTWEETKKKVVKVTLYPFDRVLARYVSDGKWEATLITDFDKKDKGASYQCLRYWYGYCIPYNKETVHLLGTTDDCPIDYEIEFSKEFKKK